MIKPIRTSLLLPAELAEISTQFKNAIEKAAINHSFINTLLTLLAEDIDQISQALTGVRLNQLVDDLLEADAVRDDSFLGFKNHINNAQRRKGEEVKLAYEGIWAILDQTGLMLYRDGYNEQTAKLTALFIELDKPENQAALQILNALGVVHRTQNRSGTFKNLYEERIKLDETKDFPSITNARKPLIRHLSVLQGVLEVVEETESSDALRSFDYTIKWHY